MQKRILALLLALCLMAAMLPMAASAETSGVAINETNFPDENFRSYVSTNFDTDENGSLSDEEIANADEIYIASEKINSLQGIEYFTALTKLDCNYNQLTTLNVSGAAALEYLDCGNNELTTLNVSGAAALEYLDCGNNELTTLNVSKNTALTELYCASNQLTSLDVSKNTALEELYCASNDLTTLDVSKNTSLTVLDCYNNQLTTLDVSKNTALTYLDCGWNELTALDVSKNTAITELNCNSNQLTTLDVSENTALETLSCGGNELTTLDVSKNTALTELYCGQNQLTTLNVSKNTALTYLNCYGNQLTTLNVSGAAALEILRCENNQLTTLDVSKNTALTSLHCYCNEITTLDVSKNTALINLVCYDDQLTTLEVSKNTALEFLYCDGYLSTSLDVSKNKELYLLYFNSNITVDDDLSFDLSTLDYFDIAKASNWENYKENEFTYSEFSISGNILTVDEDTMTVYCDYDYSDNFDCGFWFTVTEQTEEQKTEQVFSDVPETAWYYSNVMKAYEKGYMSGTGDGEFSPNATLTREQMVQILYNMEGKPEVDATESEFTDVKAGQWYTNAIIWATENNVVSGYSSTKFGVGDKVTREQMAQMFYNYIVNYLKTDASKVTGDGIAKFKDASSVSSWAKTAMNWATNGGIINGNSDGTLNPLGTATRAEAASVLVNFDKFMEKYGN